jgi:hypothetical protein
MLKKVFEIIFCVMIIRLMLEGYYIIFKNEEIVIE